MNRTLVASLTAALVLAVPVVAGAEGFGRRALETSGIDDATAAKVRAVFEASKSERRSLHERKRAAMLQLESLVHAKSADERAYKASLDELKAARAAMEALREKNIEQARALMTPSQQARVVVAMKEQARERRHGRRGHGSGSDG